MPGSIGTLSGRVNRRSRSAGGVGRISPYPCGVRGRTRVPSHGGGTVPGARRAVDDGLRVGIGDARVGVVVMLGRTVGVTGVAVVACVAGEDTADDEAWDAGAPQPVSTVISATVPVFRNHVLTTPR
ncbi:MAG: hypothetical protein ACTHNS_12870 [Marmoricola sp.]